MSRQEKPFIPLDKQVEKLEKRGLIISNREITMNQLLRTSYYDLINGYKDIFLVEKTEVAEDDRFIEGTTFEDILELYHVDRKI